MIEITRDLQRWVRLRACDHRRRQPHAAPTTTATNRDPRRSFAPDATRTTHTHRRTGPPLRQPAILPSRHPTSPTPCEARQDAYHTPTTTPPNRCCCCCCCCCCLSLRGTEKLSQPASALRIPILSSSSSVCHRPQIRPPYPQIAHLSPRIPIPAPPPTTTEIPVDDAMLKHVKRITASTGKAAWISATAFLVLIVPLIIEMDREQQLIDLEAGQLDALTGGSAASA